ncbi:MAG: hypothetical protein VB112_09900 [Oscillospiraceae bacterium]|nr:hypothetical protein [Oscillospiraceae bacterium]
MLFAIMLFSNRFFTRLDGFPAAGAKILSGAVLLLPIFLRKNFVIFIVLRDLTGKIGQKSLVAIAMDIFCFVRYNLINKIKQSVHIKTSPATPEKKGAISWIPPLLKK